MTADEKYEQNMSKAPTEIYASLRKGQAFSISSHLAEAGKGNDSTHPMKLHAGYSCFKMAISEEGTFTTLNLKPKDFMTVKARSEAALNAETEACIKGVRAPEGGGGQLLADTVKIRVGSFKNMTPSQALFEKGEQQADAQAQLLINTYNWLKESLSQSPRYAEGNKEQMDAIAQAVDLYRKGELKAPTQAPGRMFTIFDSGFRTRGDKIREDGKALVLSGRVTWTFGNTYPVEISISNYFAKVEKKEGGMINVLPHTIDSRTDRACRLPADEWMWAVHMMDVTLRSFEGCCAPRARDLCMKREAQNICQLPTAYGLRP